MTTSWEGLCNIRLKCIKVNVKHTVWLGLGGIRSRMRRLCMLITANRLQKQHFSQPFMLLQWSLDSLLHVAIIIIIIIIIKGSMNERCWANVISAFHPSVNEYQLRLGRQRQVWFIPSADERGGVQVKLWNPLKMGAIPERLRGVFTTRCYTNPSLCYLYPTLPKENCSRTRCNENNKFIDSCKKWKKEDDMRVSTLQIPVHN